MNEYKVEVTLQSSVYDESGKIVGGSLQVSTTESVQSRFVGRAVHRRAQEVADNSRVMLGAVYGEVNPFWTKGKPNDEAFALKRWAEGMDDDQVMQEFDSLTKGILYQTRDDKANLAEQLFAVLAEAKARELFTEKSEDERTMRQALADAERLAAEGSETAAEEVRSIKRQLEALKSE